MIFPKLPFLTREIEREFIPKAHAGDRAARDRIIVSSVRYVIEIARGYARRAKCSEDDLVAAGCEGLMHAIDRFDPNRGLRFISYAAMWIRAYILKSLRNERVVHRPDRKLKGVPNDVSLDITDEQGFTPLDHLTDDGIDAETGLLLVEEERFNKARIARALKTLPTRWRLVIELRYYRDPGYSYEELAEVLGVTRSRAQQIGKKALLTLRNELLKSNVINLQEARRRREKGSSHAESCRRRVH